MGCRSDYMEQTDFEKRVQRTAQLLQWFWKQADIMYRGSQIRVNNIAKNSYPSKDDGDHVVAFLCKELRSMKEHNPTKFDEIVYGRNKTARELANWWEDHEKADEKRHKKDKERRTKDYEALAQSLYEGDSIYDGHVDSVLQKLIELGFEAPKLSDEIEN